MPSTAHGWGIYGLNLMLNWAKDPDLFVFSSLLPPPQVLSLDEPTRRLIEPSIAASRALINDLASFAGRTATVSALVLHNLGRNLNPNLSAHNVYLQGNPTVGIVFNDSTLVSPAMLEAARRYAHFVAGSSWNATQLTNAGIGPVSTVLQGIDPALFHPAPRRGLYPGRFTVFSGGKIEYRKGQDLVVLAFRAFASRHPGAVLVAAWHNYWPHLARSINRNPDLAPLVLGPDNQMDIPAWVAANGVPAEKFVDLGPVPHREMPRILHEMDVALFPNRCEPGTNLVAMEAMACGVPTILACNTGHLDIIGEDTCLMLDRQAPVPSLAEIGTEGWGESDVEEIVEAIESVWRDRQAAEDMGARGAKAMATMSWARQIAELKTVLMPYALR
jgi:glycosyltransferase involved in cell wall biosynthesis